LAPEWIFNVREMEDRWRMSEVAEVVRTVVSEDSESGGRQTPAAAQHRGDSTTTRKYEHYSPDNP
jgi:hypothetical protein